MSTKTPCPFSFFADEQMKTQPDNIRRWAAQAENPLLQRLAKEVIEAAGQAKTI